MTRVSPPKLLPQSEPVNKAKAKSEPAAQLVLASQAPRSHNEPHGSPSQEKDRQREELQGHTPLILYLPAFFFFAYGNIIRMDGHYSAAL